MEHLTETIGEQMTRERQRKAADRFAKNSAMLKRMAAR